MDNLLTHTNIQKSIRYFGIFGKIKSDKRVAPPLEERVAVAALKEVGRQLLEAEKKQRRSAL